MGGLSIFGKFFSGFSKDSAKNKPTARPVSTPVRSRESIREQTQSVKKRTDDALAQYHIAQDNEILEAHLQAQQGRAWNFFMEKIRNSVQRIPEWEGKDFVLSENEGTKKFSHIKYHEYRHVVIWFQDGTSLQPQKMDGQGRREGFIKLIKTLPLAPEDDPELRANLARPSIVQESVVETLKPKVETPAPKPAIEIESIHLPETSAEQKNIRQQQEQSWQYLFSCIQAGDGISDWENKQFTLTSGIQKLREVYYEPGRVCLQFFDGIRIFADLKNLEGLKKQILRLPEVPGETAVPLSLEDISPVQSELPILDQPQSTAHINLGITQPVEPNLLFGGISLDLPQSEGKIEQKSMPVESVDVSGNIVTVPVLPINQSDSNIPDTTDAMTPILMPGMSESDIEGVVNEALDRALGISSGARQIEPLAIIPESPSLEAVSPALGKQSDKSIWTKQRAYAALVSSILVGGLGIGYYAHSKKKIQSTNINPNPQINTHIPQKKDDVVSPSVTPNRAIQTSPQVTPSPIAVVAPKPVTPSIDSKSTQKVTTPHIKKSVVLETKKSETLPSQVQSSIETLGTKVVYKQIQSGDTIWGMLKENNLVGSVWGNWQQSVAIVRARDGKITTPVDDTLARRLQIGDYLVIMTGGEQQAGSHGISQDHKDTPAQKQAQMNPYRLQDIPRETPNLDRLSYDIFSTTSHKEPSLLMPKDDQMVKDSIVHDLPSVQATVFVDADGASSPSAVTRCAHVGDVSAADRIQQQSEQFLQEMIQKKQECKEWSGKKIILAQGGKELIFEKLSYVGDVPRMRVHTADNPGTSFYIRANEPMISLPVAPVVQAKNMDQFAAFTDRLQKISDNRPAPQEKKSLWGKVKSWFA